MNTSKHKLNEDKTEAILFGTPKSINETSNFNNELTISTNKIQFSDTVKNLGVILDKEMSMTSQVTSLCKSLNFQLKKISNIRTFLTTNVTKPL